MKASRLRKQYEAIEGRIEAASVDGLWQLGDWLAANVPHSKGGGGTHRRANAEAGRGVTIAEVAAWGGRHPDYLRELRRASAFTRSGRMPGVTPSAYLELIRKGKTLEQANAYLERHGSSTRAMRPAKGDGIQTLKARPLEERVEIAAALLEDEETLERVNELRTPPSRRAEQPVDPGRPPRNLTHAYEIASRIAGAREKIRDAVRYIRREGVELEELAVDAHLAQLESLRADIELLELAMSSGGARVDWDAELAKLSGEVS